MIIWNSESRALSHALLDISKMALSSFSNRLADDITCLSIINGEAFDEYND